MKNEKVEPTVEHHGEDFEKFMKEFLGESDRAAVVLGAAKIDALLGSLLDKFLIPSPAPEDDLLEGDSPLAALSARIKICHRLGLIDDQFAKLLHTFRRLRNSFAHDVTSSSLSTGSARDRTMNLAEPFSNLQFYNDIIRDIAKELKRSLHDPGVVFRAVLAIFHMYLQTKIMGTKPLSPSKGDGIVEAIAKVDK